MPLNQPTVINWVAGQYTGDGTNGRQIALGFKPTIVIMLDKLLSVTVIFVSGATLDNASADRTAQAYIHATDGFVVETTVSATNTNARVYRYVAIQTA